MHFNILKLIKQKPIKKLSTNEILTYNNLINNRIILLNNKLFKN